jgi:hypothetical protein
MPEQPRATKMIPAMYVPRATRMILAMYVPPAVAGKPWLRHSREWTRQANVC